MNEAKKLPPESIMKQALDLDYADDVLLVASDILEYLQQSMTWFEAGGSNSLTGRASAGLGYILWLLRQGIMEAYRAI